MATNRRFNAGDRLRTVWAVASFALLAIVVVVLCFVALTQNRSVAEAGATPGVSTPPADVAQVPAEPEVPAPAQDPQPVAVPTRVMAAIDADSAVRALPTECPAPTTIEVTDDAGATWEPFEADNISTVQRITAGADAFVALIGLGVDGCAPAYERSITGGLGWEPAPDELSSSWFVDPANRSGVHAPSGDRAAPCGAIVQVAAIDENSAAVLCDDSSVHTSVDSGQSWLPAVAIPGAAAISIGVDGYSVAVVNQNGCIGAQLVGVFVADSGLVTGAPGACVAATIGPGETALAAAEDGAMWLWTGQTVSRSSDGGASWL